MRIWDVQALCPSLYQQGPPEPSPEFLSVCPRLALCASLRQTPAQESNPFHGTFPDLTIEHSAFMALLTCVDVLPAHMLREHKARYKGSSNANALLVKHGQHNGCLIARSGKTLPPAYQEYGQPGSMRRAEWYRHGGRWSFRLSSPGAAKSSKAVENAIVVNEDRQARANTVQVLEHAPTQSLLSVTRTICWAHEGPPSRPAGATRMLRGTEGMNNAHHAGCLVETPLCMSRWHVEWGSAADNARHRQLSKRNKVKKMLANLQGRNRLAAESACRMFDAHELQRW